MTSSRTERRIADARARVTAAAWELLQERPWASVTVADICNRADVAPRTFHRYFPDKAELLFADASEHEQLLVDSMERHSLDEHRPRAYVQAVLADMAVAVEEYSSEGLAARQQLISSAPELLARDLTKRSRLQDIATRILVERLGDPDPLRASVVAGVALQAFYAAMGAWARTGGRLSDHVTRALDASRLDRP